MRSIMIGGVAFLSIVMLGACVPATPTPIPGTPTTASPARIDPASAWIEVDLARQVVLLHEAGQVIAELEASTGVTSDPKYATPPGLYRVQSMEQGPIQSIPDVYVSHVIMFDIGKGNGFHSRPMDAQGDLLDATLGQPGTAGCVRVGDSARLFAFARIGMWVWIH